jgi:small-conductance mechanosensitive channel
MLDLLLSFAPLIETVIAVIAVLWFANWALLARNADIGNEKKFPRQLIMLGLTFLGVLAIVLVLPVSDSSRNQLISLIGILTSAAFAFSSTTIISNLMAGVLLRITKPFKVGDFIRIGDHFGRVSERGLFETEIQTETRELIALPNIYCINNPVATILSSGTIISATLSLGYEIEHKKVEGSLIAAAVACGLQEPFVHIMELNDFSVVYRVSGFLAEPKRIISMRSNLYACVLDQLHGDGIEIMSPSYMNQRQLRDGVNTIPYTAPIVTTEETKISAEELAFDKAEQAEGIETERNQLLEEISALGKDIKAATSEEQKSLHLRVLERKKERLKTVEKAVESIKTHS